METGLPTDLKADLHNLLRTYRLVKADLSINEISNFKCYSCDSAYTLLESENHTTSLHAVTAQDPAPGLLPAPEFGVCLWLSALLGPSCLAAPLPAWPPAATCPQRRSLWGARPTGQSPCFSISSLSNRPPSKASSPLGRSAISLIDWLISAGPSSASSASNDLSPRGLGGEVFSHLRGLAWLDLSSDRLTRWPAWFPTCRN
jgi:hypothetical protein